MIDATLSVQIDERGATLTVSGVASAPELFAVKLRAAIFTLVSDPVRLANLAGCDVNKLKRLLDLPASSLTVNDRQAEHGLPMLPLIEGVVN